MTSRRAVVATRMYLPEGGAAPFRLAALVDALNRNGYETTVITSRPPNGLRSTRDIRRWPVLRDSAGSVRGYLQYASFDIPLFFRLFGTNKPDVVIVEPPPTTGVICKLVCGLRRIPYVYFSADVASTAAKGIGVSPVVVGVLRRVERWVLRGAAGVLAVSEGVRDEVIGLGAASARVSMVGAGIDTEVFGASGPRARTNYPYFVYAGTISEIQGAGVLVDAFLRIAQTHLTVRLKVFGYGVELAEIRARVQHHPQHIRERIEFSGVSSGEDVAHWLRGALAGLASVRPERGYDFAYATKAFASISCGTPVIYAGVGPSRNLIQEHSLGWAVDWDVERVAEAMESALGFEIHPEERARLSLWAEENFSLHAVSANALTAINDVVCGSSGP